MEFIKNNNNLYSFERKIKILNSIPVSAGNNNEVVIVKGDGIYKYNNSSWVKILNLSEDSASQSPARVVGEILCSTVMLDSDEWLLCNGQSFDTTEYPELYAVLGSSNVPDLRENLLVGVGENTTDTFVTHDIFTLRGANSEKIRNIQNHRHSISETAHIHSVEVNSTTNHNHSCVAIPDRPVVQCGTACCSNKCCGYCVSSTISYTSSANGNVCATNTTTEIKTCYPIVDNVVYDESAPMRTNSFGVAFYIRAK